MSSNLHTVSSAPDFQEKLSQDLQRVSVTNFWAAWAEPCKRMNKEVETLAAKFDNVLFLQVSFINLNTDVITDIYHRLMRKSFQKSLSPLTWSLCPPLWS